MLEHPIETGHFIISTPQIEELAEKIQFWLDNHISGAIVYGKPRIGKTYALKLISETLFKQAYNIPSFYMSAIRENRPSESAFYTNLLRAFRHPHISNSGGRSAYHKRSKLLDYLLLVAKDNQQERIILLIDEAQNLTDFHYDWLIGIYNELDYRGVQLITFLVGQQQLKNQKETFLDIGMEQIVGRFMMDSSQFYGVRTKSEVHSILQTFDFETEFPIGSKQTYTQYYFGDTLKLSDYSTELFEALSRMYQNYGSDKKFDVPLLIFIPIIREALIQFGKYGLNSNKIMISDWEQIIEQTLLIKYIDEVN
ncbi:TPA: ATP-binding protein [Streptococcus suis]|nr:ATP-binding protein [Streptococcus suis]HEM4814198.1 ATP-binding protein [Streptococcus suis]